MGSPWFKFPSSFIDDPRFRGLNPSASLTYLRLFCLASRDFWKQPDHSPDTMAWSLRLEGREKSQFSRDLAALMDRHLVNDQGKPVDYETVQGSGLSSTERSRLHRERKRNGNVAATLHETLPQHGGDGPATGRAREEENRIDKNTPSPPEGVGEGEEPFVAEETLSEEDRSFERFWRAYPRRTGKWEARKAWHRAIERGMTAKAALEAVAEQAGSDQWRREGGRFVPSPASWLAGGHWLDDVSIPGDSENQKKGAPPDDPDEAARRATVAALGREAREDGL